MRFALDCSHLPCFNAAEFPKSCRYRAETGGKGAGGTGSRARTGTRFALRRKGRAIARLSTEVLWAQLHLAPAAALVPPRYRSGRSHDSG